MVFRYRAASFTLLAFVFSKHKEAKSGWLFVSSEHRAAEFSFTEP
jgi:hypothetical protein